MSKTSRRAVLAGAASALAGASAVNLTAIATARSSDLDRADAVLLDLERQFLAVCQLQGKASAPNEAGEHVNDELSEKLGVRLGALEFQIYRAVPGTIRGLAVKARVARWSAAGELDEALPLDFCRILDRLSQDIERLAAEGVAS